MCDLQYSTSLFITLALSHTLSLSLPHTHFLSLPLYLSLSLSFTPTGIPGLTNEAALEALFSLTATGLYSSYMIPILLRVTVSRESFQPAEFSLGKYSVPMGILSVLWCTLMIIILCLPQSYPITINNMNYSPIALGIVIIIAFLSWVVSARFWFKGTYCTYCAYNVIISSFFLLYFKCLHQL